MLGPAWRFVGSAKASFGGRASVVGEAGEVCARASGVAAGSQAQPADVLGLGHGHVEQVLGAEAIGVTPSRAHTPTLLPHMVQVPPGTPRLHAGERLCGAARQAICWIDLGRSGEGSLIMHLRG